MLTRMVLSHFFIKRKKKISPNYAVDISEAAGAEQMDVQTAKRGRGTKQSLMCLLVIMALMNLRAS